MKKLIIVGDSLSLPRQNDGVSYEDTYPALLQTALGEGWRVINRSRRANNSRKQVLPLNLSDDIHDYKPEVFVFHLGIVDCAPRLFSEYQQKILDRLPAVIRKEIISFFSKRRFFMTKNFQKVFVDKNAFMRNVQKTIETAKEYSNIIYVIGIAMPASKVLKRSYGFKDNVLNYNDVLRKVCLEAGANYIDTTELLTPHVDLLSDGYHFNISANKKIAEIIYKNILNLNID